MSFLALILVIILWVQISRLQSRVDELEQKKESVVQGVGAVSESQPSSVSSGYVPLSKPVSTSTKNTSRKPDLSDRFVAWIQEEWLMKLGALLLLIGFGWLVSYAFLNNWIGPVGRITLGLFAGLALLVLGFWRMKRFVHQGGIFMVVGSTTILLTIYAARELYDLFTPGSALLLMFMSSAFVALSSMRYRTRSLAFAGLVLAVIAPLLTKSPSPDHEALFLYLLVVTVGAIGIVVRTGWRVLIPTALIGVSFYSIPHIIPFFPSGDAETLVWYAFVFAVLFFVMSILGLRKDMSLNPGADIFTALGTGIFVIIWTMVGMDEEIQSLVLAVWMLVFGIAGFTMFHISRKKYLFYIYGSVALVLLATATALELSGPALVVAYTLEVAFLVLLTQGVLKENSLSTSLSFVFVGPILLSIESMASSAWRAGVIHDDFFVLALLAFVFFGLSLFFRYQGKEAAKSVDTFNIIGSLYVYVLVWLSLHAGVADQDVATLLALLVYTIVGLVTYFRGRIENSKDLRLYGAIMLLAVVGRLLVIDVWDMALAGRITTFFLIGILFMSTAFFKKSPQKEASLKQ